MVDIHHIIPREFIYHPTVSFSNYNIVNGYNLMFLSTLKGSVILNIHVDRPNHFNGYTNYNKFVGITLDQMFLESQTNEYNMCKFNKILRQHMRHIDIPW